MIIMMHSCPAFLHCLFWRCLITAIKHRATAVTLLPPPPLLLLLLLRMMVMMTMRVMMMMMTMTMMMVMMMMATATAMAMAMTVVMMLFFSPRIGMATPFTSSTLSRRVTFQRAATLCGMRKPRRAKASSSSRLGRGPSSPALRRPSWGCG